MVMAENMAPEAAPQADYLEMLQLVERLHRQLLDVVKDELDREGLDDLNSVQALLLFNIGDNEVTAGELKTRGYYQGSNVSYNLKKLVEAGYIEQFRSSHDRRATIVRLTSSGLDLCERLDASEELFATGFDSSGNAFTEMVNRMTALERGWTDHIRFGPQTRET